MEANNINCICPICGGELQARGKALFKEHHKRLWEKKVKELGLDDLMDNYDYSSVSYTHLTLPTIGGVWISRGGG